MVLMFMHILHWCFLLLFQFLMVHWERNLALYDNMFLEPVRKVKKIEHPNWNPSRDVPKILVIYLFFKTWWSSPQKTGNMQPLFFLKTHTRIGVLHFWWMIKIMWIQDWRIKQSNNQIHVTRLLVSIPQIRPGSKTFNGNVFGQYLN
jgi:hypothetical protein